VTDLDRDPSLSKLVRMFGPEKASALVRETLRKIGIVEIATPDDRLRFGGALIERGGLYEVIGRSIRVQAILQGAVES
jgi:hypothetical protein